MLRSLSALFAQILTIYFLNSKSTDPFTSKPDTFTSSVLESRSVYPQALSVLCFFLPSPGLAVKATACGPWEDERGRPGYQVPAGIP